MLTVEYSIEKMYEAAQKGLFKTKLTDPWAYDFITNVRFYVSEGKPLSTEQARISLKLLHRSRRYLELNGFMREDEISILLSMPRYRNKPYESIRVPREARYIGGGRIAFRFKRDDMVSKLIEAALVNSRPAERSVRNSQLRLYIVPVSRQTLDTIYHVITTHRFKIDDETMDYLIECFQALDDGTCSASIEKDSILIRCRDNDVLKWWLREIMLAEPNDL
jgi:hypothetical protein